MDRIIILAILIALAVPASIIMLLEQPAGLKARVVSFAGLGLSLAGLAWLNRWAERRS